MATRRTGGTGLARRVRRRQWWGFGLCLLMLTGGIGSAAGVSLGASDAEERRPIVVAIEAPPVAAPASPFVDPAQDVAPAAVVEDVQIYEIPDWVVRMLSGPTPQENAETAQWEYLRREAQRKFEAEQREKAVADQEAEASDSLIEEESDGVPHVEPPEPATLAWLRQHQNAAGYWCPRDYRHDSTRKDAAFTGSLALDGKAVPEVGSDAARVEATAQALLSFVGNGYDHKEGEYKQTCRMAILWLRSQVNPNGCVGTAPRPRVREQAFAAMAMSEVYGLSGDRVLKPVAESMIEYLLWMRRPGSGWGETITGEPNALDTTLAIIAIKSARMAGLEPAIGDAHRESGEFLSSIVVDEGDGRCHVRFNRFRRTPVGPDGTEWRHGLPVCEAAWVVSMLYAGMADLNSPHLRALAAVLCAEENKPRWEAGKIDYLYWWLATSALYQVGGKSWGAWEGAMSKLLLDRQRGYTDHDKRMEASRETLDEYGSWDPVEASCVQTGRIGSTALAWLTLQIYYRYLRLKDD